MFFNFLGLEDKGLDAKSYIQSMLRRAEGSSREEQIIQKEQILAELQRVEKELQEKAQAQMMLTAAAAATSTIMQRQEQDQPPVQQQQQQLQLQQNNEPLQNNLVRSLNLLHLLFININIHENVVRKIASWNGLSVLSED
jgi:Skp family chaperone for outer membrane proteins